MDSKSPFGPQVTVQKTQPEPAGVPVDSKPVPEPQEIAPVEPAPGRLSVEVPSTLSDRLNVSLTPEQRASLDTWSKRSKAGVFTQAMMICRDKDCPFINQCPLKYPPRGPDGQVPDEIPRPLGETCPVETHLAEGWIADFLRAFAVNETDPDFHLIRIALSDIVLDILQQLRLSWYISDSPAPIVNDFVGVNADGDPILVQKISPALEHLSKVGANKLRHLRELLGTPRAKVEARRRGWQDPASRAADAMARAAKLQKLRKQQSSLPTIDNPRDIALPGAPSVSGQKIPEVESQPDDTIDTD